ncbi:MAG TPA: class I SAM-dependent rRNA methyltransferase [Candidatus Omnitrophota bacterium]|nr:class I SAM-dependent rRNA methyltransferase [Candidatus Omnitrophota bacterium]
MRYKAIKLRSGKLGTHKPGHPWIFRNQLLKDIDPSIKPGDIISVVDSDNKFLGRGYYNSHSEITIRLLTFKDEPVDEGFFVSRFRDALKKRKPILEYTDAFRAVFSEADGLPGLIVDMYKNTAVFQLLTFGMEKLEPYIISSIASVLKPEFVYEKSVSPYREIEGLRDVKKWRTGAGENIIEIREGKAKFLVDIERGHKTGFYLDQRRSRMALCNICKGKRVLDLFSYTGGFSVSAAISGASDVTGVDIKREWLELAEKNTALNGVAGKVNFIEGDAFAVLKDICERGEKFDIVILDPPSFLKSRESIKTAAKGYEELNIMAIKALNSGGILATFSCSHNMPNEVFNSILKKAATQAKREFGIIKRCHQAEDHPIIRAIPETEYLKGYFLKIS